MSEQLYRIKPLEWRSKAGYDLAITPWGDYYAMDDGWDFWLTDQNVEFAGKPTKTKEAAKAAAEAHYRERLMMALEAVDSDYIAGLADGRNSTMESEL